MEIKVNKINEHKGEVILSFRLQLFDNDIKKMHILNKIMTYVEVSTYGKDSFKTMWRLYWGIKNQHYNILRNNKK